VGGNTTLRLKETAWSVAEYREKNAFLSLRVARGAEVYKIQGSDYPCFSIIHASPRIIPDNREYTVVLAILFVSPKGPSDYKCLGPTNPLIRPCTCRFWYRRGLRPLGYSGHACLSLCCVVLCR
jgi:hypothetical protein